MKMAFNIWLQNSYTKLPPRIWHGIAVVEEEWLNADNIYLVVTGGGSDVEARLNERRDLFGFWDKTPIS